MFTKSGIIELHATVHERLDLLLRHVATVLITSTTSRFQASAIHPFGSSLCIS
jgi:hypothetical protein